MSTFERYGTPEGRMAKRFLVACGIFFAVLFLLTFFLKNCGGWSETWPSSVWHVLNVGIKSLALSLVVFDASILTAYPLWLLERRGKQSAKLAYDIAVSTSGYVLGAVLITAYFTSSTIFAIEENDMTIQMRQFANYKEMDDEFRSFMIPERATNIKVNSDCGFGHRTYNVSCTIDKDGLMSFAVANGYRFERGGQIPVFEKNCVTKELSVDANNADTYLHCFVKGRKDEITGQKIFGSLLFVYDVANCRLYGSYAD